MQFLYTTRDTCRLCGSNDVTVTLALAPIPIATPNFAVPEADKSHRIFREAVPMDLHLCRACGLLQILTIGNPDIQYTHYIYTTSLSLGLTQHFERSAAELIDRLKPAPDSLVVEMGSNDGTLLRFFQKAGLRVLGVDPAREIARRATESGIETIGAFFTAELGRTIRDKHGPAALMIANNVIANIDDLAGITEGMRAVIGDGGAFVFETQYGADVIEKNLLDTVYHEHLTYFTVKPLSTYFARHGMEVFDAQRLPTKGGSIRVFVQKQGGPRPVVPAVAAMIQAEIAAGCYEPARYRRWGAEIAAIGDQLGAMAAAEHAAGRKVGGYGVSVGTTTLLAQFGMTDKIDMLFDDDPKKDVELIGPGYTIPVRTTGAVYTEHPRLIVVFAWRYIESIVAKHAKFLEQGGKFVVPLPNVTVVAKG